MKTKTLKPAPGDIWRTADCGDVLVAGVGSGSVTVCRVVVDDDGTVTALPWRPRAEQVPLPAFLRGRYVGVAKARTAVAL